MMTDDALIIDQRFGLGARAAATTPSNSVSQALLDEFGRYQALPPLWQQYQQTLPSIEQEMQEMRMINQAGSPEDKLQLRRQMRNEARDNYTEAVQVRAQVAQQTDTPFVERLVHFWSNHFAISAQKSQVTQLAGLFELQAIRPFVLGTFKDMLFAVEKHPAMLIYLDQQQSRGPQSEAVQRQMRRQPDKKSGLNENLAREILELHTLGVRSGYSQQDVTEFARALTGWTVPGPKLTGETDARYPGFVFNERVHEPDVRQLLGKTYAQPGVQQAEAILTDLAAAPATATHVATKLACHFAGDQPPPTLINRLRDTYLQTGGQLPALYRVLMEAPECRVPTPVKFKTPWEWLISSVRALDIDLSHVRVSQVMTQLGQPIWKPGSPAGYDDVAESWLASNALLRRVEYAQRLASLTKLSMPPAVLANTVLRGRLSQETLQQVSRAESAHTGFALLLVSPEFLRR
ncbi:DUF1800 domain-containing protein [Methylophilus sp. DW102]|uniref:DUF1800 domain-containing protein n=1 Tax=Methylophilus sp. DW102 TaxID=3095607 RepID=UPI00308B503E|nr:DUF1800 domain-containing protein [Methylophilus sp. DW102]